MIKKMNIKKIIAILLLIPSICFAWPRGTGFFINDSGYAITANHVVSGYNYGYIYLNLNKVKFKVIATDKYHDLALIKVEVKTPVLTISPEKLYIGQKLTAFGFSDGILRSVPPSATVYLKRVLPYYDYHDELIKVLLPFYGEGVTIPGMSGGPYVDSLGAVGVVDGGGEDDALFIGKPQLLNFLIKNHVPFAYSTDNNIDLKAIGMIDMPGD